MRKLLITILIMFSFSNAFSQQRTEIENRVKDEISKIKDELITIRRQIHMNPELGNREFKTAALVAGELKKLGFKVSENIAHTGVIGILEGKNKGRIVAVRADMDALPIQEENDLPFKSKVDGVMHACGHDIHTTIGLGTAKVLAALKNSFNGTVKFLFQPAEEGSPEGERGGAGLMIEEGALENPEPEIIFGLHVSSGLEVGNIAFTPGGALASNDWFQIIVKGRGTHAASPWDGIDPIVTASHVVLSIQNIRSRMTDTRIPVVISVGIIQGGTAFNIIPEQVKLIGTIRTHDQKIRNEVKNKLKNVVNRVCSAYDATADITISPGAPVTFNNYKLCDWSVNILKNLFGEQKIMEIPPSMGSEDFAAYTLKIPAFFYFIGVANQAKGWTYPVHSPKFIADEDSIEIGVEAMANLVLKFLGSSEKFSM
jgi:amidohydrolase